jgi:hypothetical protein
VSFAQLFDDPKYAKEPLSDYLLTDADKAKAQKGIRAACETLEGGWQFRGGEARGANDHFTVPGQTELSRLFLGYGMTWLRPATMMIPPIAVSWDGLDDQVAALVLESSSKRLRVAIYSFDDKPRQVNMRVWRLAAGNYRLQSGTDDDGNNMIDKKAAARDLDLVRSSPVSLELPPQKVLLVELDQLKPRPRSELLPDLAVGAGDVFYDKATDRLKVIVHNIGAAAAKNVTVRFEDAAGKLLAKRVIPTLAAPLDLEPKTAIVWMPQPLILPIGQIVVHVDAENAIEEISEENNRVVWERT